MPMVELEYWSGFVWVTLIEGSSQYKNVMSDIIKVQPISISRFDSDYIEDHLYVQVQLNREQKNRELRDKVFRIRIDYDGIDHVYIQSIVSLLRLSFN